MSENMLTFNLSGFLLLDKKKGVSSHKALLPIKKLLPRKYKVGHTGTLDPEAEGLLVVAIGKATKFIEILDGGLKEYEAGFIFGKSSDTLDIWGSVEERPTRLVDRAEVEQVFQSFIGEIDQVPPMYSAIKKDGKPLYKLARQGIEVERKSRKVTIYSLRLDDYRYPEARFTVSCSKGTYVRTLISDMAEQLSEYAVMTSLKRTKSDFFDLKHAISEDEITSIENVASHLISLDDCFSHLDKIEVDDVHRVHILNGVKVDLKRFSDYQNSDKKFAVYSGEQFIGIAECIGDKILTTKRI